MLVLDLDNTLLHSCEFPMSKEMFSKEPLFRAPGIAVFDKIKTKYHMWDPKYSMSYLVKLRPFLREFIFLIMLFLRCDSINLNLSYTLIAKKKI